MSQAKLERLMNLIAYLSNARRPLTIREIIESVPGYSESFDSARRAFERDKEEIRAMDFDVVVENNPEGEIGYRIRKDTTYFDVDLSASQRNVVDYALAQYSPSADISKSAVGKIGASNPENDFSGIHSLPIPQFLDELYEAASQNYSVVISYKGEDRSLYVKNIVAKNGYWYIEAYDLDKNTLRTFRVDRVQSLSMGKSIDKSKIENNKIEPYQEDSSINIELKIEPNIKQAFLHSWPAKYDADKDVYSLEIKNKSIFLSSIFDFAGFVGVIAPAELVEEIDLRMETVIASLAEQKT